MSAEIQHEIDEQRAAERRRAYVNRDLPLLADYDDGVDLGWDNPLTLPPEGPDDPPAVHAPLGRGGQAARE
ncbi:hypothetical protein ACFV6B_04310 [Streptomyces microflavus]|uniref:hypothetical protein n=1 Tax=Streptomyces microflavus TaxID=1919 RepID=UPI001A2B63C3|nr:hypothetical protein [Streptomyces sp. MBT57]